MWGREADGDLDIVYNPLSIISLAQRVRTAVAPGPHLGTGTETCFHPLFEIKGNGRVFSESGKGAFSSIVYIFVDRADLAKLAELFRGKRVDGVDDVKM